MSIATPEPVVRHMICSRPTVHPVRVLASDGALDELRYHRRKRVTPQLPQRVTALDDAGTAALDALLAAARRPRPETDTARSLTTDELYLTDVEGAVEYTVRANAAGPTRPTDTATGETDTATVSVDPETDTDHFPTADEQHLADAEAAVEHTADPATDTETDEVAETDTVTVPEPGSRLTDVELDVVVHMIRTETQPPRSYREMEARFRELGYQGSAARLRAAWDRVATETVTAAR
ncbi:hypothetical protein [Kitasatospora griseola]|uniref:hypothetical protein n=1 Tax=Kitasatospora griseola TaxID=2064 RepID=UPI0038092F0F